MSFLEVQPGVRLRVCDRGMGDRPIVLVHGWKGSHRLWDRVIVELARRHRVVAFDLRGMGESDKPPSTYDFDELADDLAAVMGLLDLRDVTLVGWSMGCTVVLRHLERGAPRVARLVLMNGPLRLTRAPDFPHAMSQAQLDGYLRDVIEGWPASERTFQARSLLTPDPALVDFLYATALQTPLDVVLATVRHQARLDMRGVVAALPVPVLAAYSTEDPYYPVTLAQEIARTAPDGQVASFACSAHCPPLEEPQAFCAAVEAFVESRPSALPVG